MWSVYQFAFNSEEALASNGTQLKKQRKIINSHFLSMWCMYRFAFENYVPQRVLFIFIISVLERKNRHRRQKCGPYRKIQFFFCFVSDIQAKTNLLAIRNLRLWHNGKKIFLRIVFAYITCFEFSTKIYSLGSSLHRIASNGEKSGIHRGPGQFIRLRKRPDLIVSTAA